jgi:hypothetical protein
MFLGAALGAAGIGARVAAGESAAPARFPALPGPGKPFTFAILADPQVGHADDPNPVAANARRTLAQAVREVSGMSPAPDFAVFLGDLVNVFDDKSVANFEECIRGIGPQPVLVHGNHDTRPPYTGFRDLMGRVCGFREVFYSFDAGDWHFAVIPSNLSGRGPEQQRAEAEFLAWFEADLAANKDRPTAVFGHYHLLPQGLTQLEWYTYPPALRKTLLDLMARQGNVKWYFHGHVHNGIQASIKTSWTYRGITFINAPTIIAPRNFGEEFEPFGRGQVEGGYYLLVRVDGAEMSLTGRLAGSGAEHRYPEKMRSFDEALEPRWFRKAAEFAPSPALTNGDFSRGTAGWQTVYRYQAEREPGFLCAPEAKAGRSAVRVLTRAKEPLFWANDEMTEVYQVAAAPEGGALLRARYLLDTPGADGGGYLRLDAMANAELRFSMMFRWGKDERKTDILPRSIGHAVTGDGVPWSYLRDLGRDRRGFFWRVADTPGEWHELVADVPALHDAALGSPGAFAAAGVTKYLVALGTWVNRASGALSEAWFSDIRLSAPDGSASGVDGAPLGTGPEVFVCEYGLDQEIRQRERQEKEAGRTGRQ